MPTGQITDLKNITAEDRQAYLQQSGLNRIEGEHRQAQVSYDEEPWRKNSRYVTSEVPNYKIEVEPQFSIEER